MHKAATLIIAYLVVVTALLAGTYGPTAARDVDALSSTPAASSTAVCSSDADCAQYDQAHGVLDLAPDYDAAGNARCPAGLTLLDTENPDMGDSGIVCTLPQMEV